MFCNCVRRVLPVARVTLIDGVKYPLPLGTMMNRRLFSSADDGKSSKTPVNPNPPSTLNIEEQLDIVWSNEPPIPEYKMKNDESMEQKRARLLYQSRKRGMLENGLLLSAFADRFLNKFTAKQLTDYDMLINLPSNDWEIYYWISGVKPVPPPFESDVMNMLKEFVRNERKESRIRQPDLKPS